MRARVVALTDGKSRIALRTKSENYDVPQRLLTSFRPLEGWNCEAS